MLSELTRAVVVALMTLTLGALLPGRYAHAADAVIVGMDRTAVSASPARKFDVFADGARVGAYDPYTDGARIGKYNPYTDGARIGKLDSFTEGI